MDPIAQLIECNPVPVQFETFSGNRAPAYDPAQTYNPAQADALPAVVKGSVSLDLGEGLDFNATAILYLKVGDLPAGVKPEVDFVTVGGDRFTILKIRKRFIGGVQNGWQLFLSQQ